MTNGFERNAVKTKEKDPGCNQGLKSQPNKASTPIQARSCSLNYIRVLSSGASPLPSFTFWPFGQFGHRPEVRVRALKSKKNFLSFFLFWRKSAKTQQVWPNGQSSRTKERFT